MSKMPEPDRVMNTTKMTQRIHTLDFLRIACVFAVCMFHSNMHIGIHYYFLTPFISQGAIFMVAFFILSGFSLYLNYHDRSLNQIEEIMRFYVKRLVNIYPLYLAVYVIWMILYRSLTIGQNLLIAPIELLMLQTVFTSLFGVLHNGGTWFVSCIFICYLLFPFIKTLLSQMKSGLSGWFFLICSLSVISPFIVQAFSLSGIYSNPFFRLLEFVLGMILAASYIKNKKNGILLPFIYVLSGLTLIISGVTYLVNSNIMVNDYPAYNFLSIPIFAIIIYQFAVLDKHIGNKLFDYPWVRYLSKISYAFFFAQFFTWDIVRWLQNNTGLFSVHANSRLFTFSLLICLSIAILMHECIEKTAVKILHRNNLIRF